MDEAAKKVLCSLERLCSGQECCSRDVYAKALKRLDSDAGAAAEVLASLVGDGFVDDARYAVAFARDKSSLTGWGPVKIRFALSAKGISPDIIRAALEEIDAGSSEDRLRRLLEKKWHGSLCDDPDGKLKLIRFALSRGYEYDSIRDLIGEICR